MRGRKARDHNDAGTSRQAESAPGQLRSSWERAALSRLPRVRPLAVIRQRIDRLRADLCRPLGGAAPGIVPALGTLTEGRRYPLAARMLEGVALGPHWDEEIDNGLRPAGLEHLSETTVDNVAYLDETIRVGIDPRAPDRRVQQATVNLLADMGALPARPASYETSMAWQ